MFAAVYELVSGEQLFHVFFALVGPRGEFGFCKYNNVWWFLSQ